MGTKVTDCDHDCTNKENGMFVSLVSGGLTIIITLILGSYGYTWSETGRQETEKHEWRKDHEVGLDKKFEEVKQGQKQLADAVSRNNDQLQQILLQILDEQKKANQLKISQRR